jgi:His-Xaa-Ser system radical SAM maturase HxsB
MKIQPYENFGYSDYQLMPFQFDRLNNERVILVNDVGEFYFLSYRELKALVDGNLSTDSLTFNQLLAKSFVYVDGCSYLLRAFSSKYRSRKSFLTGGPALHIFVLTLRCENSCEYCQVSRRSKDSIRCDMSEEKAKQAVMRMFESPAQNLTIEFQGGEPLLAFDLLKFIIEFSVQMNKSFNKNLQFVVASSLQNINKDMLLFFYDYGVQISTSLDGPEWLHNKNRPNSARNSYQQTLKGIDLARKYLGDECIAGMTTITRDSLQHATEIIEEYVAQGFHSIFLRPLNMYGFAVKKQNRVGYDIEEFNRFYTEALAYVLEVNRRGYHLDEVNAALALNNILTPYATGYVDMRSPCGDGTGVLIYNYNGKVYPSDESRMLLEMGDNSLCLGDVGDSYQSLMSSEPIIRILDSGVAEALPGCAECAYLPYCGANPIQNYSRYGDMVGHRAYNSFCQRQKFLFRYLFELMEDSETKSILLSWLAHNPDCQNEVVYE